MPLDQVTLVGVGQGKPMFTALQQGNIDAAIATDPAAIQMLDSEDASLLFDLVTYDDTDRFFPGGYQFTGLLTRADVIDQHPEIVQKMVNALLRTSRFIVSHSATDIAARLPPAAKADRFVFIRSIEHSRSVFSQNGLVIPQAVENNLKAQIALGRLSSGQKLRVTDFYDMNFVQAALHGQIPSVAK